MKEFGVNGSGRGISVIPRELNGKLLRKRSARSTLTYKRTSSITL